MFPVAILAGFAIAAGPAGSLDPGFGVDGTSLVALGEGGSAIGVGFQTDGRLVGVGTVSRAVGTSLVTNWGIARYDAAGGLDTTFATDGVALPIPSDRSGNPIDVAVDGSDRIVAAGYQDVARTVSGKGSKTTTTIVRVVAVVRLSPDGALDTGFGSGGVALTEIPASANAHANSVVLQPDGKVLVAGRALVTKTSGSGRNKKTVTSEAALLLRYNGNGILDTGFGSAGIVVDDFSTGDDSVTIRGLGVQSDGKVVLCGRAGFLRRYHADGTLDTGFGSNGLALAEEAGDAYLGGLAIDGDDTILASGYREYGVATDRDGLITRFGPDGSLEWTFLTGLPDSNELRGVRIDGSGRIASGGYTIDGSLMRHGFTLRLNADGTADDGFGTGGLGDALSSGGSVSDTIFGVAVDSGDRVLLAGGRDGSWLLARYLGE